ncbi:MAG TPA: methyl-accepting chemotaxis protein [Vicinamibacterales bacterium]|nr:methyl-accepting chemotaxis protein [Vicinamibacterales bacterium]
MKAPKAVRGAWTIGKRLFAGFGTLMLVFVCGSGAALVTGLQVRNSVRETRSAVLRQNLYIEIQQIAPRVMIAQEGALAAAFDGDQDAYAYHKATALASLPILADKTAKLDAQLTSDADRELIKQFRSGLDAFSEGFTQVCALIESGKLHDAQQYADKTNTPVLDASLDALAGAGDNVRKSLEATAQSDGRNAVRLLTTVVIVLVVQLPIGFGIAWAIRGISRTLRDTGARLRTGAERLTTASRQVAGSAQALSQGATEQAASLEETSASMEEMASMTRNNVENASQAARLVNAVAQQVDDSHTALVETVDAMTAIKESSRRVAHIIKTIDEIAFQTNILALNAAVEAARAGSAGMGFAVVADEVRNLAQRSAQAARDTATLIEESIGRSQAGAAKVEQWAAAIGTIAESMGRIRTIVEDVREASGQQAQGIHQVSQTIAQMEKVTQSTAASAEEGAAASEELYAQSESAMTVARRLEELVGRVTAAAAVEQPKAPPRLTTAEASF